VTPEIGTIVEGL